ncbi:hypothetical protein A2619_03805 [candidate division WWE3 bacterium RIFOXYD1_FULL_39_9]|nr:MAG: hypothetical protein A2619_03805 [candidate division WWE3 bacterium RIFOXYD1_FULL_39_9]
MAVAVFVRFFYLDALSLRLDEAQSIWQASHSLEFIKTYMLKNVHLPLHNSLLHFWISIFGTSEISVRTMSAIPGVLTVPALYLLSKEIMGRKRSLLTMFLGAISPIWVWYSREIRMYTLLTLVTTISYLLYVRIMKYNKSRDYILYTLVNVIGIYTHYFFTLVLFVQMLFFLISFVVKRVKWGKYDVYDRKKQFAFLSVCGLLVIGSFLPWVYMLYKSYGSGTLAPVLAKPTAFNLILSYFEFTNGFLPDALTSLAISIWPVIILLGFIFLTKRQNPFSPGILLALMGATIPVFIIYSGSVLIKPMYLTRYLITITPMYYILLAWYFTELVGKKRIILTSLFILTLLFSLYLQATHPDNPVREDYRAAVSFLNERTSSRDIIILAPPYTIYPFQYYYEGTARVSTIPIWNKKKGGIPAYDSEKVANDVKSLQANHKKMYLLLTTNLENSDKVKAYFDEHYTKLEKHKFSKDVWIEVYQAEY